MAFDFTGRKVLVTGAGRGVGRGVALALAAAGCQVYGLDINQQFLDTLVKESPTIVPVHQDLSKWQETRDTLEQLEVLDGLVNCAAIFFGSTPALEYSKEEMDQLFSVNLMGYINCIQVVAKKMIDAGKKGAIVNISSIVALNANPKHLGYNVAKTGVDMVTKQFALELGPAGIRVNSVNPTMVATELVKPLIATTNIADAITERTPMGRYAEVKDIVGPVMYLLSEHAAMVTGTSHVVDGGLCCNITTKQ